MQIHLPAQPGFAAATPNWRTTLDAAAGAACLLALHACHSDLQGAATRQAPPVPVTTAEVTRGEVASSLTGLGTVAASQTVTVRPQVEGRLAQVTFREGEAVARGQLLGCLDLRPFKLAVQSAEGALRRDAATLKNARLNLARNQNLRTAGLISEQVLTDQQAVVDSAAASSAIDQAALDQASYQLEQARIVSPIDGVTGTRLLDAGNLVRAGDANGLVVVTQLDPIAVFCTLPENTRAHVAAQMQQHDVVAEAYTHDEQQILASGRVLVVDNQMAQGSGTVRLKILLDNPNHALWPGQFVKVKLRLETLQQVRMVPASAVQRGPDGEYVYVVDATQHAVVRPVTRLVLAQGAVAQVGGADKAQPNNDMAYVTGGVEAGETVVVDGQLRLQPNAAVTASPSKTGPAGPAQGPG